MLCNKRTTARNNIKRGMLLAYLSHFYHLEATAVSYR